MPRVNTPRVVDLPLSTLPTTAHLTSGVRETFGGGSLNKTEALGCPVNTLKIGQACSRSINVQLRSLNEEVNLSPNFLDYRCQSRA